MDVYLSDKRWRRRNSLWLILAFIPFVNFLALIYIGHKAEEKKWLRAGLIFGALTTLFFTVMISTNPLPAASRDTIQLFMYALILAIYFAVFIICLKSLSECLSIFAEQEVRNAAKYGTAAPAKRHFPLPLLMIVGTLIMTLIIIPMLDFTVGLTVIFGFVPLFCAIAALSMQLRAPVRTAPYVKAYHILSAVAVGVFVVLSILDSQSYENFFASSVYNLSVIIVFVAVLVMTVVMIADYKQFRMNYSVVCDSRCAEYSCLNQTGWKVKNSLWLLILLTPFSAPLGLLYQGISCKKKNWLIHGIIGFVLIIGFQVCYRLTDRGLTASIYEDNIHFLFQNLLIGVYITSILSSFAILPQVLYERAAKCKGYANDAERRSAAQTQMNTHFAESRSRLENMTADRTASKSAAFETLNETVSDAKVLDINTCTAEELQTLPGMTSELAGQAIDYRNNNGAFASVDDFVSAIGLKPHIAIRLFPLLTVSVPEDTATVEPKKQGRRTIDL